MNVGNHGLAVMVAGRQAAEYAAAGTNFVAGKRGSDYTLRLVNRSRKRAKVVCTIDGVSILDGRPLAAGQLRSAGHATGYIVAPLSVLDVPGWRVSDTEVARFLFADRESSYGKQEGASGDEVGWIRAAFFNEVTAAARSGPLLSKGLLRGAGGQSCGGPPATLGGVNCGTANWTAAAAPGGTGASLSAAAPAALLGTTWGGRADHEVRQVEFTAAALPATVLEIRYEEPTVLLALGLDVDTADAVVDSADPDYCRPPRHWRG